MKQQTMSRWHSKSRMLRTAALSLLVATAVALAVAGCGDGAESSAEDEQASSDGPRATVTIAAAPWSSAEAGANLVKVVLEEHLDYRVSIRYMPADEMWETVASGEADATVSAWLPVTHAAYAEEYGNDVVDLGANVEGVQTGLVVPRVSVGRQTDATGTRVQPYIPATSIAELGEYAEGFGGRIVGIEPTAGIMQRAREALEVYDLEGDFRLVEGSEEDM
ncbi:MAG: glycine betaine ABC transporter substrate-binding protein, partial [Spirochaetia bacterium]